MRSCCNALSSWVHAIFTVYHDLCRRTAMRMRRKRRGSTSCRYVSTTCAEAEHHMLSYAQCLLVWAYQQPTAMLLILDQHL